MLQVPAAPFQHIVDARQFSRDWLENVLFPRTAELQETPAAQLPQPLRGKRLFYLRGGPYDFSCASCHGEDNKRVRLQDLPNLTRQPGAGNGFGAWPAYRVSNGQMWSMQLRLNDCYRQQRFPEPEFGADALTALSTYLGVNSQGSKSIAPAIKR